MLRGSVVWKFLILGALSKPREVVLESRCIASGVSTSAGFDRTREWSAPKHLLKYCACLSIVGVSHGPARELEGLPPAFPGFLVMYIHFLLISQRAGGSDPSLDALLPAVGWSS